MTFPDSLTRCAFTLRSPLSCVLFLSAASFLLSPPFLAVAEEPVLMLEPMTVLGDREELFNVTGSASFISAEEIRAANATNVNQVFARVPGVYVREEDGFGNFPNISLRGADGTRSEKVTVMEDGILAAPAPYSGPAAYSTPRVARMSGIEILKGSSQVRYGPQTTGGVINYLSTPVPDVRKTYLKTTYGSYNTFFGHFYHGDTVDAGAGRLGYLLEFHGNRTDGFREIDRSGRDSGFKLFEPMIKLSFEPGTNLQQRFEFKAGYTRFDANETYTGLTERDLARNPNRRYAATVNDNIVTDHYRTHLKWIAEPTDALRVESALYYNNFSRNWYKLDKVRDSSGARRNLHEVLAPANDFREGLGVLRGTAPGLTEVKANNRSYESYGWQNQANILFDTGSIAHDLAVGLRLHHDYQNRDHWMDTYEADGSGNFRFAERTRVGQDNRKEEIFATALYVEDEIKAGNLTLRPGVRYEWLELDERKTVNAVPGVSPSITTRSAADENLLMAGVGASYQIDDAHSLFGGIYRGVSSPGVGDYLSGVEEEVAVGYELGVRHRRDALNLEFAGFFTDFSNLISTDTGLAGEPTFNAGEAEVYGLEAVAQYDPGVAAGLGYRLPLFLSATWTQAAFKGTTPELAGGSDGIYAGGRDGNAIPYIPEWKLAAGVGVSNDSWGLSLDASYLGSSWGTGYNGDRRDGVQTSRDGRIDELLTFNLSGHHNVKENVRVVAGVQNLFDERSIVSRIPEGPRTNAPRMFYAGLEIEF